MQIGTADTLLPVSEAMRHRFYGSGKAAPRCKLPACLLVSLHDVLIQHVRHLDLQVEDARPRLVADVQQVLEALADHESASLSLALQQCVRCHLHMVEVSMQQTLYCCEQARPRTVVPMRMAAMRLVSTGLSRGILMPVTSSSRRRMPSLGASL